MASVLPLVSWLVPLLSCTITVQASCEGDSCAHAAQSPSLLSVKSELHSVLASATATLPGLDLSDGNGSTLNDSVETMIRANLAHDFEEHHNIPDPATNQTEGDSGMGSLGRNIEFMFLKVAELETIVELQQAQIMSLTDRLNAVENKTGLVQKEVPKESIHHPQHPEKVQNIFKKVWKKHHYQREKKRFVTPDHPAHPSQKAKAEAAKAEAKKNEALLQRHQQENHQEDEEDEVEFQEDSDQDVSDDFDGDTSQSLIDSETNSLSNSTGWRRRRRRWLRRRIFSSVVNTVSNAASSAVNSVTNTMADAYSQAADKVAFVANTAIDSVEMAVDILTQGFSDWSADCPEATKPSLNVDSNGVSVNWGRQKCRISLMGQRAAKYRSTQFDEEECQEVNLSPALDNANSWGLCPDGYFFHGLKRGPHSCNHIGCIEWGKCCRPKGAGRWGQCQIADWSTSFDDTGSSTCPFPYGLVGLYRSGTSGIQGIELAYCCELGVPTSTETSYYLSATEYAADWSSSFDSPGWSSADGFITGFHRSSGTELYYLETAFYRKPHEGWTCKHGDWSASLDHAGWNLCPEGYYIKALERSNNNNLHNVEKADCCKPNSAPEKWGPCYEEDWSHSFDHQHSDSKCKLPNTALVGLERDEWDNLSGIKTGKCCQLPPATMSKQDFSIR